jgi:hypothetical protein
MMQILLLLVPTRLLLLLPISPRMLTVRLIPLLLLLLMLMLMLLMLLMLMLMMLPPRSLGWHRK